MTRLSEQAARLDVGSYPVRFTYRTLFSDMDTNRHLNNVAFGRLFEEGRAEIVRRVFGLPTVPELTMMLATITIEFIAQARYPGSVEVASAVARVGGSSFALDEAAYQDGVCVALAACVMVKAVAGQTVPLTEPERDGLSGLMFAGAETGGSRW
ncbi:MAG TPA: acyl-CoA thioesterase [Streptosporangiaceae bacterium]|nr:acyl-CoA thioesterase [Streptosporangiaceae bacterium]